MRKVFVCGTILMIVFVVCMDVFATGAREESTNEEGVATLSLWIHSGYTNMIGRWGKDPVSRYIMEKTGVNFDIQTGDGTNDDTKVNLMITSGDMPDMLIIAKRLPVAYTLQREGVVEDIAELAETYQAPNLLRLIQEADDINLKYNRFKDGNYWGGKDAPLYVWPDYFVDKYTYENDRLNTIQERDIWIARKDIYEDFGSPNLNDLDTFLQFLRDVRDAGYVDTNNNPIKVLGLQPFSEGGGLIDVFAATFTGDDSQIFLQDDGSVVNNFELSEYKDAILFLNVLYREKILDQEIFTETYDQWTDKLYAGGVGLLNVYYWHVNNANTQMEPHGLQYWPIPSENVPRASGVDQVIMNHGWNIGIDFGWRCNFISTGSMYKEEAVRFLDFMYGHEGEMLQWYGMPGEYYAPADAWQDVNLKNLQAGTMTVSQTSKYAQVKEEKGVDFAKETGVQYWMFWNIHGYADFAGGGNDALSDPYTIDAREQVQKLSKYDFSRATFNDTRSLAFAEENTKAISDSVEQIKQKWMPQIIMAASENQAAGNYDKMLEEMRTAGLDTLDKAYTQIYQEKMVPLMGDLR